MHGEVPELKRCCFCLPLRRGLIGWGYTKLVMNTLAITYLIAIISWYLRRSGFDARVIAILTAIGICLLIDVSFNILFIVAGHKKSIKLLNVSYVYNLVWFTLMLLGNCFQLYMNLTYVYRLWGYEDYRIYIILDLAVSSGLAFGTLFVQIYLILLIRSEIKKLRKQSLEMQFTNLTASEPQCTLHNASNIDGTGKKHVVQDCTGKKEDVRNCCAGKTQCKQDCNTEKKVIV